MPRFIRGFFFATMSYFDFHVHFLKKSSHAVCCLDITELEKLKEMRTFFTLGIHPWFINPKTFSGKLQKLECVVKDLKNTHLIQYFLGLGECGLDRLHGPEFKLQKNIFESTVSLAKEMNLPMVIHCVKAYPELISVHNRFQNQPKWTIHGFSGNFTNAKKLIDLNIMLSFGPNLLKSENLKKIFSNLPLEMIFLETDEKNIPIKLLYEKAAKLRSIELNTLNEQINKNLFNFFAISQT